MSVFCFPLFGSGCVYALENSEFYFYLCFRIGSGVLVQALGLKGNRVRIPNSPAAVKLHSTF